MPKTYALSAQQFSEVSALPGPERYKHFVSRISDWQNVRGLRNEAGWAAAGDESGNSGFPVWPHYDYALACAVGEWSDNSPSAIEVHEFVESWLPNMAAKGVHLAVFPTPSLRGVLISASELQGHIQQELSQIE